MPATPYADATSCNVCGEAFQAHTIALCSQCGKAYHLNQRQDLAGKDCGDVWISDEHMALEFACNLCLKPPEALDEVLDLEEAAQLANVAGEQLARAAERGGIKHRKTGAGVLLFQRSDVIAFAASAGGDRP